MCKVKLRYDCFLANYTNYGTSSKGIQSSGVFGFPWTANRRDPLWFPSLGSIKSMFVIQNQLFIWRWDADFILRWWDFKDRVKYCLGYFNLINPIGDLMVSRDIGSWGSPLNTMRLSWYMTIYMPRTWLLIYRQWRYGRDDQKSLSTWQEFWINFHHIRFIMKLVMYNSVVIEYNYNMALMSLNERRIIR